MAGEPRWKTGLSQKQVQAARRRRWEKSYKAGREAALQRSGGLCERCGAPAQHVHHKRGRLSLEANLPEHLMPICLLCHDYIHKHPAEARAEGYMGARLT